MFFRINGIPGVDRDFDYGLFFLVNDEFGSVQHHGGAPESRLVIRGGGINSEYLRFIAPRSVPQR